MRLVNDREEKPESAELGFVTAVAYSVLTAFGLATILLSPLPMILAHARLTEPWPKVTALAGAVIALAVFEVPLGFALPCFILGLFVADAAWNGTSFWELLRNTLLIAVVLGFCGLLFSAQWNGISIRQAWPYQVDALLEQLKVSVGVDKGVQWEVIRGMLLYEGPFLYLGGVILSLWLSIGIAAHLGWFEKGHPYAAGFLRRIRFPAWLSLVFGALMVATFSGRGDLQKLASGVFRLVGCLMFVQGCVCLSEVLAKKAVSFRARSLIYSVALVVGFYALVGIGAASPWISRKHERLEGVV